MLHAMKTLVRPPVLIFQMGKVGSSSLETTLARHIRADVIHAHALARMTRAQQRLVAWRKRLRLPIYVISPIREPVARNVSAFFHNFKRDTGFELPERDWSVSELRDLFLERCRHNVCLEWFDAHLRPVLDIDVFAEPFPIERKWQTYRRRGVRLLVYRTDLDHVTQLDVINRFLGCAIEQWEYANRSDDKEYANVYRRFRETAKLPDVYLNLMHRSRFCRHFWSDAEIAGQARKWRG